MRAFRDSDPGLIPSGLHLKLSAWLLACLPIISLACGHERGANEKQAVVAVQRLGGELVRDSNRDGDPVVQVDLADKPVSDADLAPLRGLTQLKKLVLRGTRITDTGLQQLAATVKLRDLDLDKTTVTDSGMIQVARMTSLRGLCLSGTGITDAGLVHLRPLAKLWLLGLAGTEVSDEGLNQLQGLTNLRTLDLQDTKVTEAGVARLRGQLPHARISFQARTRSSY